MSIGRPLILVFLMPWLRAGESLQINGLIGAAWVGMLVTSLNLFPVGQLDGGHAAYALSRRLHRHLTWTTLFALAVYLAVRWTRELLPAYFVWFLILFWMRDRHPRLVDESAPLGPVRGVIALVLLMLFVLSFIPVPFEFVRP
jgi:membrane-associated protease RseP (regulator of RpoE activity)